MTSVDNHNRVISQFLDDEKDRICYYMNTTQKLFGLDIITGKIPEDTLYDEKVLGEYLKHIKEVQGEVFEYYIDEY
jgi:hypothetical protein